MDPGTATWLLHVLELALGAMAFAGLVVLIWIWMKGRRVNGDHVFIASRMTRGNRVFPAQVAISPSSITLVQPRWIGTKEESIHLAHVASIKIDTRVLYSDVVIESSGGQDPVVCHGHTKADAVAMKQLIERFQSDYYRAAAKAQTPATPGPNAPPKPAATPPTRP
jgi:hypothetical protein